MTIPGRKEKLFELQKAWAVALSGRPRVVFIEGQQDRQKSQLIDSFLEMIRGQQTTDKRPLVGRGRCFEIDGWSEPLRPAWDALCGMLDELEQDPADHRRANLSAVAELASVVPDAHIARIGQTLAGVVCDGDGEVRIPREHYLDAPDLVLRDAILTLTSEWPVALCLDGLELADAATLSALTDLLDILWEHDQPFYFLLVLTCEPEMGRSRRVLDRIEELLERYDRPKNRIVTRVRLEDVRSSSTARSSNTSPSSSTDKRFAQFDATHRRILTTASVQGRRFSPATVAAVCALDEIEVTSVASELCLDNVLRRVSGPSVFELFGCGVFEFKDPDDVDTLLEASSPEQRQLIHGRIADHLSAQRTKLRDHRAHGLTPSIDSSEELNSHLSCQRDKLSTSLAALDHMIAGHLHGAARSVQAASALRDVEIALNNADLDQAVASEKFALGERTRQLCWLARLAEETLLSLMRLQPGIDPKDVARASYMAACAAAECRLELGEEKIARQLFERAVDHARWLEDDELECRILHHITEPTKEIL
jgi:predicted ATPase